MVCCTGDGGLCLRGAGLLELCGGDLALCSLLARHVLSAHFALHASLHVSGFSEEHEGRAVVRVRGLQESLARAYCGLLQPSALWNGAEQGPSDVPIADLQADLDAHVRRVAGTTVHLGVLEVLADAADFHLSWAGGRGTTPSIALPVLLFRMVCTILAATGTTALAQAGTIRRHIRLLTPALLGVACTLVELMLERVDAGHPGASDMATAAARAALDAAVAVAWNGLWAMGSDATTQGKVFAEIFFGCPRMLADTGMLARLTLFLLEQPPDHRLLEAYGVLGEAGHATFWQQIRLRGRLCQLAPEEVLQRSQAWLGEAQSAGFVVDDIAHFEQLENEVAILDRLIDRCLLELPESLRMEPPEPPVTEEIAAAAAGQLLRDAVAALAGDVPQSPVRVAAALAAAATEWPVASPAAAPASPAAEHGPSAHGLGALGLPALPGQLPRGGAAPATPAAEREVPRRRLQRLARGDIAKIRGVDPSQAPEELCCCIDGKLLGTALRSPYGHLFEKETLENWLSRCGSVCPITGKPLRVEDCEEDRGTERQVIDWVKAAKLEHKRRSEERRARRGERHDDGGSEYSGLL